ncbi:hypothetical protein [Sphingobium sp. TB-6]|uniref:hypothetical protein n=1 Tax=Sphingobium sp. TB-6 TaxID=2728850 RepID=UPI001F0E47BB|nr:hypothetical protein [Sphingobium sp. TB-6]
MSNIIPDDPLVERFNARLLQLNSSARVALTRIAGHADMLELRDDEENFLEFIPAEASPEMTAIAFRLYARGLNRGVRAGEDAAWAKLRYLIGAATAANLI